jgi:hypothetical protein
MTSSRTATSIDIATRFRVKSGHTAHHYTFSYFFLDLAYYIAQQIIFADCGVDIKSNINPRVGMSFVERTSDLTYQGRSVAVQYRADIRSDISILSRSVLPKADIRSNISVLELRYAVFV